MGCKLLGRMPEQRGGGYLDVMVLAAVAGRCSALKICLAQDNMLQHLKSTASEDVSLPTHQLSICCSKRQWNTIAFGAAIRPFSPTSASRMSTVLVIRDLYHNLVKKNPSNY